MATRSGTPTPKRKRIPVTWAGLLSSIEEEQRLGFSLEELLSDCVSAEDFIGLSSRCTQKILLDHALPGQSELCEQILEQVSDYQPKSLANRIDQYLVAPSKVSDLEVAPVASVIFGTSFADINELRVFAGKNKVELEPTEPQPHIEVPARVVEMLEDFHKSVHNLSVEEAPGYPFLTVLLVYFGDVLSAHQNLTYKCHPQRIIARNRNPGQNPMTDLAIILKCLTNSSYISKVLYEYKPLVSNSLATIVGKDLIELILQCFYVLQYEKQKKVMGCLTDLINWHYFDFNLKPNGKLEIAKYFYRMMHLPAKKEEISSHVHILLECLNTQP